MGLVYSETSSGLVLAEQAQDEAAVSHALRAYDPELRLVPQPSETLGKIVYKVYRWAGNDRPARFVCAWINDRGEPLPLSHRLLELVKQLDPNTRSPYAGADKRNAELRERRRREARERGEEIVRDHVDMAGKRYIAPRSVGLRQTRDRKRARGEKA